MADPNEFFQYDPNQGRVIFPGDQASSAQNLMGSNWGGVPYAPGYGPNTNFASQQQPGGIFSQIGGFLGSEKTQGAIGGFASLANIYTGFKALGLAGDQLDFAKSSFNRNFDAQAKTYNNNLKDQWAARNASANVRGESYQGMDSWMKDRQIT